MSNLLATIPVPMARQLRLAYCFWGPKGDTHPGWKPFYLEPYFQYYSEQCVTVCHALRSGGSNFIASEQDLLYIISHIRNDQHRTEVKDELLQWRATRNLLVMDDECANGSIDLAVRLLTMVDIGCFRNTFTGRDSIIWNGGTLKELLHRRFAPRPRGSRSNQGVKLDTAFTANNLNRIGGLDVRLTTNMADHLLLLREEAAVLVFHHAAFLKNQQNDLFPVGFIEETLQTLALLFPPGDKTLKYWYSKQSQRNLETLDHTVFQCGSPCRDIEGYVYWYDRLSALKEIFDDPPQTTLRRLWHDRRDVKAWFTLWVVIALTLFFGFVQNIEGAWQIYKAYNPS